MATSTYRAAMLLGRGGLDQIQVRDLPLEDPGKGEVRVRVSASGAGATDLTMRTGYYPFAPAYPFPLGYEVVGVVDKIGPGCLRTDIKVGDRVCALIGHGGMAEYCTKPEKHFVKVEPDSLKDEDVVALILNFATAYQMLTRKAKVKAGSTVLITGANGGVGSALLQLCRVMGVTAYGYVRKDLFDFVKDLGGIPIEDKRSSTETVDQAVKAVVPEGVDCVFDVLGGYKAYECLHATKHGGILVGYGFAATFVDGHASSWLSMRGFITYFLTARFSGRTGTFYGITADYRLNPKPFKEDLVSLFDLLAKEKIKPAIAHRLPLLAGRRSQELMEAGRLKGKIVMLREVGLE